MGVRKRRSLNCQVVEDKIKVGATRMKHSRWSSICTINRCADQISIKSERVTARLNPGHILIHQITRNYYIHTVTSSRSFSTRRPIPDFSIGRG